MPGQVSHVLWKIKKLESRFVICTALIFYMQPLPTICDKYALVNGRKKRRSSSHVNIRVCLACSWACVECPVCPNLQIHWFVCPPQRTCFLWAFTASDCSLCPQCQHGVGPAHLTGVHMCSSFRARTDVAAAAVHHPEEKENGGKVPAKCRGEEAVAAREAGPATTQSGTADLRTSCYWRRGHQAPTSECYNVQYLDSEADNHLWWSYMHANVWFVNEEMYK